MRFYLKNYLMIFLSRGSNSGQKYLETVFKMARETTEREFIFFDAINKGTPEKQFALAFHKLKYFFFLDNRNYNKLEEICIFSFVS